MTGVSAWLLESTRSGDVDDRDHAVAIVA